MTKNNYLKYLELFIITIISPVIIIIFNIQKYVLPIIFIVGIFSIIYLKKKNYKFKPFFIFDKKVIIMIFVRVLILYLILFIFLFLILPDKLTIFPKINFKVWFFLIFAYPLLSVLPQEIFFRVFFFERYSILFKNKNLLILSNGLIFSFMHSIYLNFSIILITFFGGYFFAKNYYYNKSLFLVTVEHSLLGNFIFSLGLGYYFHDSYIKNIYTIL